MAERHEGCHVNVDTQRAAHVQQTAYILQCLGGGSMANRFLHMKDGHVFVAPTKNTRKTPPATTFSYKPSTVEDWNEENSPTNFALSTSPTPLNTSHRKIRTDQIPLADLENNQLGPPCCQIQIGGNIWMHLHRKESSQDRVPSLCWAQESSQKFSGCKRKTRYLCDTY